ncbi:MAG TPA: tRNA epoxyqueuosine(34) reductase QueG [Rhodopila sp.]|uniref:tRNA epoxyqueuosine(34) reductase QueG n=1 Tax=Rhodopila sp. TaxID=2480087 RepID=UPI002CAD1831|nr:tRNA epoxyqueuosine(34) reductase QueG [Rhodopila sp.]HVY13720.1 tRNA epoxyqueuosine(34) reductase QueG [Rhodopila sp.]
MPTGPKVSQQSKAKRATIREHALSLGFQAVGFCRAALPQSARERLGTFIEAGFYGDMGWLADRTEQRSHPQSLWPDARSVVVVGLSYAPETDPLEGLESKSAGNISVYARNRDYHDTLKGRLKHLAQQIVKILGCDVKVFVDTAPVMEKPLAQHAGIGWQGKHTNLVSRSHGSWLFLGEIYTTAEFDPDDAESDHCGSCSSCLSVCPTQAFPSPYRLDSRRCISYLTIEHRGPIPLEFRRPIGNRIYGCDDCLAVCPWNKFARPAADPAFLARQDLVQPPLGELALLDDRRFREKFSASPIKRIGRDRFVRNVLIAVGNSEDASLIPIAETLRSDPDPVVSEAATWAKNCLSGQG